MQKKCVRILVVFLVLVTAGCSAVGATTNSTAPSPVFKTPEDAINYYFAGVAAGDIDKIRQACAIDEMSEKYRLDLEVQYLGNFFNTNISEAPANYPFYVEINKMQLANRFFLAARNLAYSVLSSEKVDQVTLTDMDAARMDKFMKDVDPKRLVGLEVKKIDLPHKALMNAAGYLASAANNARSYGADDHTERVVLFTFEQSYYFTGFSLLRYGDSWKLQSMFSGMGRTNASGFAQKTTAADFDNLVNK